MRKQFLIPFCAVAALLAVVLIWLVTHKEQLSKQPSEVQAPNTNASAVENPVRQSVAIRQTNATAKVAAPEESEHEPTNEAEMNAKARKMLEARNRPLELWGKVVDQNDAPLSGVKVEAEIGHFAWPPEQYPNGVSTKQETTTDTSGQFDIHDNSAEGVYVILQKDGYEQESQKGNGYALGAGGGSKNNPIVLKMWSTNSHEQLITGNKSFEVVPDGRPYFINLTDGSISERGNADLKVWIQYTNQVVQGQLSDWSAGIEIADGGLWEVPQTAINSGFLEEPSVPMYSAPKDGYTPSFQLQQQIKGGQRGEIGNRYFYLLLNDGKEYGRMSINLFAPYGRLHPGLIRISYAINPSGSRILR
jgi:hypothetical protein